MYSTVLVALDGSKNAERALAAVRPLLAAPRTRTLLVTVRHAGADDGGGKPYLEELARDLAARGMKATAEVLRGDPATAILAASERRKADLVAFATHGEGGLSAWVFGSVAQKLLRGTSKALLIARALEPEPGTVRRVLVPLDGSVGAEAILPHAFAAARAWKARVVLLHVLRPEEGRPDREKRRMESRFDEIARGQKKKGLEVESLIDEGDPADRILHHAERRPGTLVALGSHGRTAVSRWRYGSIAEKILQAAKVPLLVGPRS